MPILALQTGPANATILQWISTFGLAVVFLTVIFGLCVSTFLVLRNQLVTVIVPRLTTWLDHQVSRLDALSDTANEIRTEVIELRKDVNVVSHRFDNHLFWDEKTERRGNRAGGPSVRGGASG